MTNDQKLAYLCIATAMFGLLLGSTINGYMLLSAWPIPFGPELITFGSGTALFSLLALVGMVLFKQNTKLLMIPVFFAGTAPAFCIVITCMAGYITDGTFRHLTVLSIALAIAVITFLAFKVSLNTTSTEQRDRLKVAPVIEGI